MKSSVLDPASSFVRAMLNHVAMDLLEEPPLGRAWNNAWQALAMYDLECGKMLVARSHTSRLGAANPAHLA